MSDIRFKTETIFTTPVSFASFTVDEDGNICDRRSNAMLRRLRLALAEIDETVERLELLAAMDDSIVRAWPGCEKPRAQRWLRPVTASA